MAFGVKVTQREIFGEKVHMRPMNGGKMAVRAMELSQKIKAEPWLIAEMGALMVCASMCDADGKLLHDDPDKVREDAPFGFLTEFATAAMEISGLGDDAKEVSGNLPAGH